MKRAFSMVMALALTVLACSKDTEVAATLGELDSFTAELVAQVKSSADPAQGVERAQKHLQSKGESLRTKLLALKGVRNFQISEETKKKMVASVTKNATAIMGLQVTYAMKAATDPAFKASLDKLTQDYRALVTL